jgi:SAM-dependent methyltransferase
MRWVRCRRCNHIFTEGYYTEQTLRLLLGKANAHQTPGKEVDGGRLSAAHTVAAVSDLRGGSEGRWLDVGFGGGALLATASEFGYQAVGIDVRSPVVDAMRELGYDVRCVPLAEFRDESGFDVISLADVLEHIAFPREALWRVHALLRPAGLVFVSSPNMDSLAWRIRDRNKSNPYWGELEHYHNFDRGRLYALLRDCGLQPERYFISRRYIAGMEVIARRQERPVVSTSG